MARFRVGVQLHPQATTVEEMRAAWKAADALGVDSIWTWDHFFPLYGDPDANHYEAYTLLAAMAVETHQASIGALVTCNSYRNPHLLADMARTVDHISGGRLILGLGAGWFQRDYDEFGYEFGTTASRLRDMEQNIPVIRERLAKGNPAPTRTVPFCIPGAGKQISLGIVAREADIWHSFGTPEEWGEKNAALDEWCAKVGRDPKEIERSMSFPDAKSLDTADAYVAQGATHFIIGMGGPVLARLGAVPYQMGHADVFSGLENGTLDAAEFVCPHDDEKLGFVKAARFNYFPCWWEGSGTIHMVINADKWSELPKAYQSILARACEAASSWMMAKYDIVNPPALRRLWAAGAVTKPFPQPLLEACYKATGEHLNEIAAKSIGFKKALDSMNGFRGDHLAWRQIAEHAFDTFMISTRSKA